MAEGSALHVGRYEIVGRIGAGGMAEVLLGRLRGPHGFERPVVIKRILPHLVLDPRIVDMFLDEAKIIANLRHPNLIHVHELGIDGTELFMSMEYLEGESLASLCRRLASRGEYLDYTLAAQILAEACAGLHAAHEAKSNDGRALEIVHRDVSPQNILVTYSGTVHVIDFGIATTVDRISRTEVGAVRGKFEYAAPEQLLSQPLSRRTDVFGLGIVLFELATGRRLYKRASHAEAVKAILNEPVPAMASFRSDAPSGLERICARALAKNPDQRFASAADMRRALLTFLHERTDDDLTGGLGRLMEAIFSDRVTEKVEMLGRVRRGDTVETFPDMEVDVFVELPTVEQRPDVSQLQVVSGRRKSWLRRATIPALATAALIGLVVSSRSSWRISKAFGRPETTSAPVVASVEATPNAAPEAPVPSSVRLRIESVPSAATVFVQGRARGVTPLSVDVDRGGQPLELVVSADGYESLHRMVVPDADQLVDARLTAGSPASPRVHASAPVHIRAQHPTAAATPPPPGAKAPSLW